MFYLVVPHWQECNFCPNKGHMLMLDLKQNVLINWIYTSWTKINLMFKRNWKYLYYISVIQFIELLFLYLQFVLFFDQHVYLRIWVCTKLVVCICIRRKNPFILLTCDYGDYTAIHFMTSLVIYVPYELKHNKNSFTIIMLRNTFWCNYEIGCVTFDIGKNAFVSQSATIHGFTTNLSFNLTHSGL